MILCQGEGQARRSGVPIFSVVCVKLLDDTLHFMRSDNLTIDEEAAYKGLQHSLSREQNG
jgi:hypothetical protein